MGEVSFFGDLPDPGIKPTSPALKGRFFTAEPPRKPQNSAYNGANNGHSRGTEWKGFIIVMQIYLLTKDRNAKLSKEFINSEL